MGLELFYPTHCVRGPRRPAILGVVVLAFAGAIAWAVRARPFGRALVEGQSMMPALQPGDRLLYGPAPLLRSGQVVAVRDPRTPDRLLVKRVRWSANGLVDVRGDNAAASTDSGDFGPVPRSLVAGRLLYRYSPLERAGWWRD